MAETFRLRILWEVVQVNVNWVFGKFEKSNKLDWVFKKKCWEFCLKLSIQIQMYKYIYPFTVCINMNNIYIYYIFIFMYFRNLRNPIQTQIQN